MKKAYESSLAGATVVCLVPARTDTEWWHKYAMKGKIEFLKGRLKFGGHKNSAPFPSAIVTFGEKKMITLHLDTETTDLPKHGEAVQDGQARICQLAMILCDENEHNIGEFCAMIKPDGWQVQPGAFKAHGVSTEKAAMYGVPISMALYFFSRFVGRADRVVAFNASFDWQMLWIEHMHAQQVMSDKPWHCTMRELIDVLKIPPTDAMLRAGRNHYKSPNLAEAYKGVFGIELNASLQHNAMYDVRASKGLYFKRQKVLAENAAAQAAAEAQPAPAPAQRGPVDWEARERGDGQEAA